MKRCGMVLVAIVALAAAGFGAAEAQPVFRAASISSLPGSTGDATGLAVLVDVTSPDGTGPDGALDLVVASLTSSGQVTVKIGRGDGTFIDGPSSSILGTPMAIAAADLDGDQHVDLLIGDSSNSMRVLKGNGDGTFTRLDGYSVGPGPRGIALADFDGDHKLDAAVASEGTQGGDVRILLGNGDATFTEIIDDMGHVQKFDAGFMSSGAAAGDFDGDNHVDLAVSNEFSNDVTIFKGDGHGSLTKVQTLQAGDGPIAIVAHDLNGDGKLDLAVTNSNADSISVFVGASGGTFGSARVFSTGTLIGTPRGLALADVDADGHLDLVAVNNFSWDAAVLYGDGTAHFAPARLFVADAEPAGVVAGDLNGDGAADVVAITQGGGNTPTVATLLSRGDGSLVAVENLPVDDNPSSVVCADVDDDGRADVIVGHSGTDSIPGTVRISLSQSSGGFVQAPSLQVTGKETGVGVAAGDFNGDGRLDIALVNRKPANVAVFLGGKKGGFGTMKAYDISASANAVVAGDWNRDGRTDLAVVQQGGAQGGVVEILLATAAGGFGTPGSVATDVLPLGIDSGDFNKDGKLDLVVANNGAANVSIILGNGDGTFLAPTTTGVSGSPRTVAVADFDRDGFDDIAVGLAAAPTIVLLYGDGQGHFTPGARALSVGGNGIPSMVTARDLSGDGIPDLLAGDEVNSVVKAFIRSPAPNTRSFTSGTENTFGVNRRPISVFAADVDGDGRYDGIAADSSPAPTASVLTNIRGDGLLRGDGNGDGRLSAADAVAVMLKVREFNGIHAEDAPTRGAYAARVAVDANGDGIVTLQDVFGLTYRLFNPSFVGL
ncbi:MAG: VCBS repeat-containing protein [Deltaproteobacteria bacterium]|nr:VCBS repeat-containing protein [Deltaproteobacteria bacterium]